MDPSSEPDLDARLARIEAAIAALQHSVNVILSDRARMGSGAHSSAATSGSVQSSSFGERSRSPARRGAELFGRTGATADPNFGDRWGNDFTSWFSSRAPEWWLSRLGIGFVVLAVLFLYGYAIDKGWITPVVRVLAGLALGGALFWLATRTPRSPELSGAATDRGLRELFFGGALAVWYISAYAAAVWYGLIAVPTARLLFFLLAIVSTWIALQEEREVFALLAMVAGLATPFLLPAPPRSASELSYYLALVTAIGLVVYLLRGWHSIVWITFVGFWLSIAGILGGARTLLGQRSVAVTILLVSATAAFARVPSLRRQVLSQGSERYRPLAVSAGIERLMEGLDSLAAALGGGKSKPDSLVYWVLPLISPILAVNFLQAAWRAVPNEAWGVLMLALAALAFVFARRGGSTDDEAIHVAATAAALWAVLSIGRIVFTPESIAIASLIATIVMASGAGRFAGARLVAKATVAIALTAIVGHELGFAEVGLMHLRWVLSGLATIGCAAVIAQALTTDPKEKPQGLILAFAAYLSGLVLLWRMLEPVWPPLVTMSYAIVGATLLVLSRRPASTPMLRRLGAVTMVVVVARLLLVDLSSVETIWRVLLFLLCGAVFLYTAYRLQPEKEQTNR